MRHGRSQERVSCLISIAVGIISTIPQVVIRRAGDVSCITELHLCLSDGEVDVQRRENVIELTALYIYVFAFLVIVEAYVFVSDTCLYAYVAEGTGVVCKHGGGSFLYLAVVIGKDTFRIEIKVGALGMRVFTSER